MCAPVTHPSRSPPWCAGAAETGMKAPRAPSSRPSRRGPAAIPAPAALPRSCGGPGPASTSPAGPGAAGSTHLVYECRSRLTPTTFPRIFPRTLRRPVRCGSAPGSSRCPRAGRSRQQGPVARRRPAGGAATAADTRRAAGPPLACQLAPAQHHDPEDFCHIEQNLAPHSGTKRTRKRPETALCQCRRLTY